jgi:hypothetical protein
MAFKRKLNLLKREMKENEMLLDGEEDELSDVNISLNTWQDERLTQHATCRTMSLHTAGRADHLTLASQIWPMSL